MIYIKHENGKISYTHYMPFHEKHGLGKTKEELEVDGILVDAIPEPEQKEGKVAVLHVNPKTKELFYEYEDAVLTEEEELQAEIESLKASQEQQDEIIMELLLGGM